MDANELTEVCRLCPSISTPADSLLDVFDSGKNMKEVILVTTGIEILESDLVSKKICKRCCRIAYHMYKFRQDALKQDRMLKEKCNQFFGSKYMGLLNSCMNIKRENELPVKDIHESRSEAIARIDSLHSSVESIYKSYPLLKIPKKCMKMDWSPVVSLTMGDVEKQIGDHDSRLLESYRKATKSTGRRQVKTVAPLKISKRLFGNYAVQKKSTARKRSLSASNYPEEKKKKIESETNDGPQRRASVYPSVLREPVEVSNLEEAIINDPIEAATTDPPTPNTTQPEFLESFGLTQTVTTLKSQQLLTCSICGSLHNNSFELKRHSLKHMTCQFCKRKLRTWELKQFHIDNECQVRRIMNSPGIIPLERIELVVAIRDQYKETFVGFKPISVQKESTQAKKLVIDETDEVVIDVVLISDDESESPPVCLTPFPSSSLVKPDVRIKRIDIPALNDLPPTTSVKELIKIIQEFCVKKITLTNMTDTDLPDSSDIVIADSFCILSHLRNQLTAYKLSINVFFGNLHVKYSKRHENLKNRFTFWTNCQVGCKRTPVTCKKPAVKPVVASEVIVIDDEPEEPPSLRFFQNGFTRPIPMLKKYLAVVPPPSNKTIILNNYMFQNGKLLTKNQGPTRPNTSQGKEPSNNNVARPTHNRRITTPLDIAHRRILPKELEKPVTNGPAMDVAYMRLENPEEKSDTDGPALRVRTVSELT